MTLKVHDPAGTTSEARHSGDGTVSLEIRGTGNIGKRNEGRVVETLAQRLAQDGVTAMVSRGLDDRGEDGILRIGTREFVLQITTAPVAPDFWKQANLSSARTDVPEPHAASWIRDAIIKKAAVLPKAQLGSTILAVDARHAGVLALSRLLGEYLRIYGRPEAEFGFASIWIVGPTADQCERLGGGYP
jgi:hypothetical protein